MNFNQNFIRFNSQTNTFPIYTFDSYTLTHIFSFFILLSITRHSSSLTISCLGLTLLLTVFPFKSTRCHNSCNVSPCLDGYLLSRFYHDVSFQRISNRFYDNSILCITLYLHLTLNLFFALIFGTCSSC